MKTVLIDPPHYYLCHTLAIPRLTAYLRAKGHTVLQKIVDNEIYDFLFSPKEMKKIFEKLEEKKSFILTYRPDIKQDIENKILHYSRLLPLCEIEENKTNLFEQILKEQSKITELVHHSQYLLRRYFVTLGKEGFKSNFDTLEFAAWLISLAYFPTTFDLIQGISMRYSPHVINDILKAINDKEENFLIDYYQREILPWILEEKPDLIGVSLSHFSQFVPGFTLMDLIKQNGISSHVTIGGAAIIEISRFFKNKNKLWDLFDSLVIGIGEYALDELIKRVDQKTGLEDVPNLIYKDGKEIKVSTIKKVVSLDDVKTPEYIEERAYPIISIETSVGCPYGKCVFCHYPYIYEAEMVHGQFPYQERSIDLVIEDIIKLNEKYKPLLLNFTDTSISAKRLEKIAEKIMENKLEIYFWGFIRAEKAFTSLEFCKKLARAGFIGGYFGLESASQRINDLMSKNIDVNDVIKILKNFNETGIIPNIFCMIGFPTETREEAFKTRDFILENKEYLKGEISLDPFMLQLNTPILKNPDKYKIIPIERDEDFPVDIDYKVSEGLSQEETIKLLRQFYRECNLSYLSLNFYLEIIRSNFLTSFSKLKGITKK